MESLLFLFLFVVSLGALVSMGFLVVSAFKRSVGWGLAVLLVPFVIFYYGIKFRSEVKKPFIAFVATNVVMYGCLAWLFVEMGGMKGVEMAQSINDGSMTQQQAAEFMVEMQGSMEKMGGPTQEQMLEEMRKDPNATPEQIAEMEHMLKQIDRLAKGEIETFEEGMAERPEREPDQQAPEVAEVDEPVADETVVEAPGAEKSVENGTEASQADEAQEASASASPSPAKSAAEALAQLPGEKAAVYIKINEAANHIGRYLSITLESGVSRQGTLVAVEDEVLAFEVRKFSGSMTFNINKAKITQIEIVER